MNTTLIAYYTRTGNNNYLVQKLKNELNADIEQIKPRVNSFFLFVLNIGFGVKKFQNNPGNYDKVILVGPIWMGRFVRPLRDFLGKYLKKIKQLHFVTCCGSSYEKKEEKFGHELVFNKVKTIAGNKLIGCTALPIVLVVPEDKLDNSEYVMKTRLSDENFKGEILDNFNTLVKQIKAS